MTDGRFVPFAADGSAITHGVRDQVRVLPERIEPVKLPKSYYLSSLLTIGGLLLLCVAYFMMTVGVPVGLGYLLYLANTTEILKTYQWLFWVFLLGGPGSLILSYFMLQPLFGRRGLEPQYLTITERDQGLFFAFLERLCRAMGAPMPDEVTIDCQVNASVRRLSGFWGRERLRLTLGTPLIRAFTASQLAGVIAHELAHFRQKGGRRLGYAIETMLGLFALLAHYRSPVERQIAEQFRRASDARVILFYFFAGKVIGLARLICRGLAWVGNAIVGHHRRQLEYDADRWEARLVGNSRFAELERELVLLGIAYGQAMGSIREHEEEGRYPIDLADYALAFRVLLPDELAGQIWSKTLEVKTGLFDSHPSSRDRIANVEAFEQNPPPELDIPALDLFRDWIGLTRLATRVFYCQELGEAVLPGNLHSTEELLGKLGQNSETEEAHERYFCGAWSWLRPLRLGAMIDYIEGEVKKARDANPAADLLPAAVRQIVAQRDILLRESPRVPVAREKFWEGVGRLVKARAAEHLHAAGAVERLRELQLPASPSLQAQEQSAAAQQLRQTDQALAAFENAIALRLALALAGPGEGRLDELRKEAFFVVYFLRKLEPEIERIRGIVIEQAMVQAVRNLGEEFGVSEEFQKHHSRLAGGLMNRLKQVYFSFEGIPHPLVEELEKKGSVSDWLLLMPEATITSVLQSASALLGGLPPLVYRSLGRLAQIAEEIEKELGLPVLDLTPPEDIS